jgi:hypothetical protein
MGSRKVFLSVGSASNPTQERFISAIEGRLRQEGLDPHTVGRTTHPSGAPLKAVESLMDECVGTVVLALERSHFPKGTEKRGGAQEAALSDVKLATPWNQIEAAMSYSKGLPLLVLVEHGLKSEGLLEKGYDWFVQWVEVDERYLGTPVFNGTLADWKSRLADRPAMRGKISEDAVVGPEWTLWDVMKRMRVTHIWAAAASLFGAFAVAFLLGARIGPLLTP